MYVLTFSPVTAARTRGHHAAHCSKACAHLQSQQRTPRTLRMSKDTHFIGFRRHAPPCFCPIMRRGDDSQAPFQTKESAETEERRTREATKRPHLARGAASYLVMERILILAIKAHSIVPKAPSVVTLYISVIAIFTIYNAHVNSLALCHDASYLNVISL